MTVTQLIEKNDRLAHFAYRYGENLDSKLLKIINPSGSCLVEQFLRTINSQQQAPRPLHIQFSNIKLVSIFYSKDRNTNYNFYIFRDLALTPPPIINVYFYLQ